MGAPSNLRLRERGGTIAGASTWSVLAAVVSILAVGMALPSMVGSSLLFRVGLAVTAALLALAFNIIFGYAGMVSFGHAALYATGGYIAAILLRAEQPILLALVLGALGTAVLGAIWAAVALRSSGIYFAIITLALGQIVFIIVMDWTRVTGGVSGLPGVRAANLNLGLAVLSLDTPETYFRFLMVMAVAIGFAMWLLSRSRFTRVLSAVRDDPERAAFLGVDVYRHRLVAFVISSAFAGLAGALSAPTLGIVYPELARWDASAAPILAALLGGSMSYWGPAVGALAFEYLAYVTRDLHHIRVVSTGAVLLAVLLLMPGGFAAKVGALRPRLRGPSRRTPETDDAPEADRPPKAHQEVTHE